MGSCNRGMPGKGHATWCESLHGIKTTKQTKRDDQERDSRNPRKVVSDRDGGSKWRCGKR